MGDHGGDVIHLEPLAVLRRRTAGLHRAVERSVGLLAPDLTVERYASVLAAFARVHRALDADLTDHAPLDLPYVGRAPLAVADLADLAALGHPDPSADAAARPPATPIATSLPRALGARYVVEGSRLGGAVLVRHLRRVLGDVPVRYLTVDGGDATAAWAAFTAHAERTLRHPDEVDAAAGAAVAVFRRFHDELTR